MSGLHTWLLGFRIYVKSRAKLALPRLGQGRKQTRMMSHVVSLPVMVMLHAKNIEHLLVSHGEVLKQPAAML